MNKDITYYLPKFFETELRSNDNCSENTIISYKYAFILLLEFVKYKYKKNINNITLDMFNRKIIEEYLEYLEVVKKSSVNTRNQRLAAIKSFFKYLTYEDIKYLPIYNEISTLKTKKNNNDTIKYLTKNGIKEILSIPNSSTKEGIRDLSILTLLYDSGARVQELINLKCKDINFDNKTIYLYGKGQKARIIPLITQTIKILEKYLNIYNLDKNSNEILFFNSNHMPLSRMGITYIINKYVEKAKRKNPIEFTIRVTPHTFRHSKAMHLLESGVNLIYIRDFLGHKSIITTEIYAKTNPETKRKAIEKNSENLSKNIGYTKKEKEDLLVWLKTSLKSY